MLFVWLFFMLDSCGGFHITTLVLRYVDSCGWFHTLWLIRFLKRQESVLSVSRETFYDDTTYACGKPLEKLLENLQNSKRIRKLLIYKQLAEFAKV